MQRELEAWDLVAVETNALNQSQSFSYTNTLVRQGVANVISTYRSPGGQLQILDGVVESTTAASHNLIIFEFSISRDNPSSRHINPLLSPLHHP